MLTCHVGLGYVFIDQGVDVLLLYCVLWGVFYRDRRLWRGDVNAELEVFKDLWVLEDETSNRLDSKEGR